MMRVNRPPARIPELLDKSIIIMNTKYKNVWILPLENIYNEVFSLLY